MQRSRSHVARRPTLRRTFPPRRRAESADWRLPLRRNASRRVGASGFHRRPGGDTLPGRPAARRFDENAATPPPDTAETRLPRRFGGYELLEEIGHGGIGVVYKARQFTPERMVALKVIRAGELATEEDIRLFRQEADEAARLDHPSIVPVYEVGEQDGLHFFTMKLVEGGGLDKQLDRYRNDPKAAARSRRPRRGRCITPPTAAAAP